MKKYKVGVLTHVAKHISVYDALYKECEVELGAPMEDKSYRYSPQEMVDRFGDANALICGSRDKITREFMAQAKNLYVISKSGIGVDNIDLKAATEMGILVCNSPIPENYISTAEGAVTHMLVASKIFRQLDIRAREGKWKSFDAQPTMIYGKTVGIIGFGRIGQAVAERIQGWHVRILVYDPFLSSDVIREKGAEPVDMETLCKESDIISPHLNLTAETRHLLSTEQFKMMKPTAYIVNTSRGGVVDQDALVKALESGEIAGAGIDVFENEPLKSDDPICKLDNVFLTPHSIALTKENLKALAVNSVNQCLQALNGSIPQYVANKDVLSIWKAKG